MEVHKFGGSSVANASAITQVCQIVTNHQSKISEKGGRLRCVVVSAMGKTTDNLISCIEKAYKNQDYRPTMEAITKIHMDVIQELVPEELKSKTAAQVNERFLELQTLLSGISTLEEASERSRAKIMSYGERLSAFIISQIMKKYIPDTDFLDARNLVKTNNVYLQSEVDFTLTNKNISNFFNEHPNTLYIATGFIGSVAGLDHIETTLLGRGGSDYSASIIGAAIKASLIIIWTDVDGVMTCDPRRVGSKAQRVPRMTFQEAMELSFFGAKVIYAPTMGPAMRGNVPMLIKSTFLPDGEGTYIEKGPFQENGHALRGITSITNVALVVLEGCGMVGVSGVASRLFMALNRVKVNVILITQASSEHSICLAVDPSAVSVAKSALEEEFEREIAKGHIDGVLVDSNCSIIAVVGDGMNHLPGVLGKIAGSLGRAKINVRAVAQGSSERNISLVIDRSDETQALNVIHDEFFLQSSQTIRICLVDPNGILCMKKLSELLTGISHRSVELVAVGIYSKGRMLINPNQPIPSDVWETHLERQGKACDFNEFSQHVRELLSSIPPYILLDVSNYSDISQLYLDLLKRGHRVVTANVSTMVGPYHIYRQLIEQGVHSSPPQLRLQACIHQSVPVFAAVDQLVACGTPVRRIRATLCPLFSEILQNLSSSNSFSNSFTQSNTGVKNPLEHFNGLWSGSRMLLLARYCGLQLEYSEVKVESYVKSDMSSLKDFDAEFENRRVAAEKSSKKLCYVSTADIDEKRVEIKLEELELSSPLASEGLTVELYTTKSKPTMVLHGDFQNEIDFSVGVTSCVWQLSH